MVGVFFHWVSLYAALTQNLMAEDRMAMLAVLDDDAAFDKWLVTFDKKQKDQAIDASRRAKGGAGAKRSSGLSNDEVLAKYGKVYTPDT